MGRFKALGAKVSNLGKQKTKRVEAGKLSSTVKPFENYTPTTTTTFQKSNGSRQLGDKKDEPIYDKLTLDSPADCNVGTHRGRVISPIYDQIPSPVTSQVRAPVCHL